MNTQRPPAVTVAVVLLALLSVVNMVPPSLMASPAEASEVPAFVTYLGVILGVVGLVAAYGLWALKRWGRLAHQHLVRSEHTIDGATPIIRSHGRDPGREHRERRGFRARHRAGPGAGLAPGIHEWWVCVRGR